MTRIVGIAAFVAATAFTAGRQLAGQGGPVTHSDRVYAAEQFSNTVSVSDPAANRLVGVIRLGDPTPGNFSPLYRGQLLVHGLGFSPDHRTIVVVSIGSNSVTFIETATNAVKHITYVGRSPHEAFFTPDGSEVWVTVRGENYVAVLDAHTYEEKARIVVPGGPGMQIFSPDGQYGYVCSSFTPETVVITVKDHQIVGRIPQETPFCPNIAVTPDGGQVWLTLKDVGKTMVFSGRPPFALLKTLATGPITNHVKIVRNSSDTFAYVTVGGLNRVQVFRTDDFSKVATIPIGQAPQAVIYVSDAVPTGAGTEGLQPLGVAGAAAHITLAAPGGGEPTSVSLFDQGLIQVLQAAVTGLEPGKPYVLALARRRDGGGGGGGGGPLEPLAAFTTNPAGAAVVDAIGPIRQIVRASAPVERRYLVIAAGTPAQPGPVVQTQVD